MDLSTSLSPRTLISADLTFLLLRPILSDSRVTFYTLPMLCYRGKKSTSCSPSRPRETLPDGIGLISSQTMEGKSEHFEGSILKQGLSGTQGSLSPSLRVVLCNGDSAIRIIFRNEFNPSSQFWLGWMLPRFRSQVGRDSSQYVPPWPQVLWDGMQSQRLAIKRKRRYFFIKFIVLILHYHRMLIISVFMSKTQMNMK